MVAHATLHPHGSAGREVPFDPREFSPFNKAEMNICGPVDCGDRNGFHFPAGILCSGIGAVFLKPMQAKSEAVTIKTEVELFPSSTPGFIKDEFGMCHNRRGSFTSVPAVQSVGVAQGHAGSRVGLSSFLSLAPKPPLRKHLDADAAVKTIKHAQLIHFRFGFGQKNPEHRDSASRYDVYKAATSFAELATFRTQRFDAALGRRVPKGSPVAKGERFCE